MPLSTSEISVGELVRLAFPPGTQPASPSYRDRKVKWVLMAGAGVTPEAGDFVLCGVRPSEKELATWEAQGVVGVAVSSASPPPRDADLPIVILPAKASLRDVQQASLELIVNRQSYLLERGVAVYQILSRQSVESTGLEGLAQAMLELTGKTVLIQDKRLRPLAQAVAPEMKAAWPEVLRALNDWRHLPETLHDRRQAAALAGWRDQSLPDGCMRLICPIIAKGMARGYLSIVGRAGDLDALDQLVVEYGAAACALEMAKAKAVSDAEKRAYGAFLDAVIAGTLSLEEMTLWAERIGYDVEPPHAALAWRWVERAGAPSVRRLETIINQSVAQQGVSALVRPRGSEVVVFCALTEASSPEAALALARLIRKSAAGEYPHYEIYGGIGRSAADLSDWRDSYREASQALSVAERLNEQNPLYFGDLLVYRLLFQLEGNPELENFCREVLGSLLDYEGGGDLLETLEAFCDRLGNLSQTAEKLFIHRNSLLYRMERLAQITGLDLNHADTRLAVHLALKVRRMLKPSANWREKKNSN